MSVAVLVAFSGDSFFLFVSFFPGGLALILAVGRKVNNARFYACNLCCCIDMKSDDEDEYMDYMASSKNTHSPESHRNGNRP